MGDAEVGRWLDRSAGLSALRAMDDQTDTYTEAEEILVVG